MKPTVTLETKCWERDWKKILCTDRLQQLSERNLHAFDRHILMINNVEDISQVAHFADVAVADGRITGYVVVQDHAAAALDFFGLTATALGRGYIYSIAELVSIYLCETDYLLHFAGDCLPHAKYEWVSEAIDLFASDGRIRVANLSWNIPGCSVASEAQFGQLGDFYLGYGFSDQCYLIRTKDFRDQIYGETHPSSKRYPKYGGELFEKRVNSWMRNHGFIRATYMHGIYDHEEEYGSYVPPSLLSRWRYRAGVYRQAITHALLGRPEDAD